MRCVPLIVPGRKAEAMQAAALVLQHVSAQELTPIFRMPIRPEDWAAAQAVGSARLLVAQATGNTRYGRHGRPECDALGALGELLLGHLLQSAGAKCAALVAAGVPDWPDIELGGLPFEVKTLRVGARYCNVNKQAHDAAVPAAYLAVRICQGDELAEVITIDGQSVSSWPEGHGHSAYYRGEVPAESAPESSG